MENACCDLLGSMLPYAMILASLLLCPLAPLTSILYLPCHFSLYNHLQIPCITNHIANDLLLVALVSTEILLRLLTREVYSPFLQRPPPLLSNLHHSTHRVQNQETRCAVYRACCVRA